MPQISPVQKRLQNFELQCTIGRGGEKKKKRMGCPHHAPSNVVRKIKDYDPEIDIWFNRVWGLWMLFRRGHAVMTVKNEDGSYRPLDHRVIYALKKGDLQRRGMKVLDEIIDHNEDLQQSNDADFEAHVKDTSEEFRKQFRKRIDSEVGALNIPKEDARVPEKEVLEIQRQARSPMQSIKPKMAKA
jgi:hypothetical protein